MLDLDSLRPYLHHLYLYPFSVFIIYFFSLLFNSISDYICVWFGRWSVTNANSMQLVATAFVYQSVSLAMSKMVLNATRMFSQKRVMIVVFIVFCRSYRIATILQHLNRISLVLLTSLTHIKIAHLHNMKFIRHNQMACCSFVCVSESFNYSSPMSKIRLNKYTRFNV